MLYDPISSTIYANKNDKKKAVSEGSVCAKRLDDGDDTDVALE